MLRISKQPVSVARSVSTLFLLLTFLVAGRVNGLSSVLPSSSTAAAMREWLLQKNRLTQANYIEVSVEEDAKLVLTTTRAVAAGQVLFGLATSNSIWSAADAYRDRDLGPQLVDLAKQAGPGFGVVALAGAVAAERVRRYRGIQGQGTAPESIGFSVPSQQGAFARWLWERHKQKKTINFDKSLVGTVELGVNLLVPMLELVARRAWSSAAADDAKKTRPPFLSQEWSQEAMFNDGSALSWSRSELENLALNSFDIVLQHQLPPPPYLLTGTGSLVPEPFVDRFDGPETWPTSEPLALVPLIDDLRGSSKNNVANAVLGSPPKGQPLGKGDCLWCVATRALEANERIVITPSS